MGEILRRYYPPGLISCGMRNEPLGLNNQLNRNPGWLSEISKGGGAGWVTGGRRPRGASVEESRKQAGELVGLELRERFEVGPGLGMVSTEAVADARAPVKSPGRSVWSKRRAKEGALRTVASGGEKRAGSPSPEERRSSREAPEEREEESVSRRRAGSRRHWVCFWQLGQSQQHQLWWRGSHGSLVALGELAVQSTPTEHLGQSINGTHDTSRAFEGWHLFTQFCLRP